MSPHTHPFLALLALLGLAWGTPDGARGQEPASGHLRFHEIAAGQFAFDTQVIRGRLRSPERSFGLEQMVHVPTQQAVSGSYGLMSVYRVFSDGRRYGNAGWEWPSDAVLNADGSVTIRCTATEDRPFLLEGTYRWITPTTLDLQIDVVPNRSVRGFEVFLASYYDAAFDRAAAWVGEHPDRPDASGFLSAERSLGDWLTFPRDVAAIRMFQDGRWELPPHPVTWSMLPRLAAPLAVRRQARGALTALTMASSDDCFAVSMPYETEGHYSIYLSLFGRDLPAGQVATAHARWQLLEQADEPRVQEVYREYQSQAGR